VPRYVILEHTWRGVHWDVMLETGDSLRTWAIDTPIVPCTVLPARALPNHRLAYLDYEGPVSRGRGSVRRLDHGTFSVRVWSPAHVVVLLEGGHFAGEAELLAQESGGSDGSLGGWTFRLGNVI
jgi:hypothetical protein